MSHVSHPPPSTQPFCLLFPSHPVPPSEAPLFVNKDKIINDNKNLRKKKKKEKKERLLKK
jgi:hypothetical protein